MWFLHTHYDNGQEGMEDEDVAPVVVVQIGRSGGKAWGVSPDAAVAVGGGDGDRQSWKAFRDEVS